MGQNCVGGTYCNSSLHRLKGANKCRFLEVAPDEVLEWSILWKNHSVGSEEMKETREKFGARKNLNAFLCPFLLFGGLMKTTEAKIPSWKFVYFYDYLDLSEDTNLCVCVLGVRVGRLCVCVFGNDPMLANRLVFRFVFGLVFTIESFESEDQTKRKTKPKKQAIWRPKLIIIWSSI